MVIYTIYDHPRDYPDHFVVRCWIISNGVLSAERPPYAIGNSLEAIRLLLPPGLYCLGRQEGDEPQIVETWV